MTNESYLARREIYENMQVKNGAGNKDQPTSPPGNSDSVTRQLVIEEKQRNGETSVKQQIDKKEG